MKVLIIGNGGREHALAWKVAQSTAVDTVYVAPGNGGTALEPRCQNVAIAAHATDQLIAFALENDISLTIVGPEAPLAHGCVDQFQQQGLACFGPSQAAAQLEASKIHCKQFMAAHHIPTADFALFSDSASAIAHLATQSYPIVIKADGLAAGKGVIIAQDQQEAEAAITAMLDDHAFGDAGHQIIIETCLYGHELSFIAVTDGQHIIPLASSQDHKRLLDNDQGPNTGGMGAYSPAPLCTPALEAAIMEQVMQPTVRAMHAAGTPYVGFLYAGLMIGENNDIQVLEFNCRLGDPETQPLMMRLKTDLVRICQHALDGTLNQLQLQWHTQSAMTVVMAAGGYPQQPQLGDTIQGVPDASTDTKVFHGGTALNDAQDLITSGGRVLGVTALGNTLEDAKNRTYAEAAKIHWNSCHFRSDIGQGGLS